MNSDTRRVELPNSRVRKLAALLIRQHPIHSGKRKLLHQPVIGLRVICISDTHNRRPQIPEGDILIHSGDLTENGSFEEVQRELQWLSSLPHKHKIFIAGNHDVLLDSAFLEQHPERTYGQAKTKGDLDWGDVHYLEDSSLIVDLDPERHIHSKPHLKIFGSPRTPQYGVSAFQFSRAEDIWTNRIPKDADVVVTHGPPHLHLDRQSLRNAGCPYLAEEIFRVRPRLMVFGHIHVSHGREEIVLDGAVNAYDSIQRGWGSWLDLVKLVVLICIARIKQLLPEQLRTKGHITTLVNASVVGGTGNELLHEPIIIDL